MVTTCLKRVFALSAKSNFQKSRVRKNREIIEEEGYFTNAHFIRS